ncbi:MAG: DUF5906 domain-containing protein [Methylovulum sp.]|nr:DUF5906 domain-containing protein [Methylovulum sp.]
MASNYPDVQNQIFSYGLRPRGALVIGKMARCPVEGDKEKRGWYHLHEITDCKGQTILVGAYGIWYGNENNSQKIELGEGTDLSKEQLAAIRQRLVEDKKRADADQKRRHNQAALRAEKVWKKLIVDGDCDYLHRKGVANHGGKFSPRGAFVVPMIDTSLRIWGLQFILDKDKHKDDIKKHERDKHFWPPGLSKKGHYHLIGMPAHILLLCEGYATAATLHEATLLPVAVGFDARNLEATAKALRKRYPKVAIVICADNDIFARCLACKQPVNIHEHPEICPHCNEPHKRRNTGKEGAELAALAVSGHIIMPRFKDENACFDHYAKNKGKLTDFNDLHVTESLHTVTGQIDQALHRLGLRATLPARDAKKQGGGENTNLKPIDTAEELLERFALVYGKGGMVFDSQEHSLITLSDMRDLCQHREVFRRWQESAARLIVRPDSVGFDPAGTDANITCNLWSGWPTEPKQGNFEMLLSVLYHMCSGEQNALNLAEWIIKWLAYPIQHPGAKMRTTLVLHGPQGTGKNLFFEAVMAIYGHYGRVIDQSAVEDKFNDWASKKLFLVADEVVARSDLYHIKNKLKAFITGEWIRVNPKNMAAYEERNHVNMVFLSNDRMPVVIEEDDRRHCIIWTPPKKEPEFYKQVGQEIDNGGIPALHHWLLSIDLGDFNEHSKPPMTVAKEELMALSKDSILRFYDDWINGEMDGVPIAPTLSEDLFKLYRYWCGQQGVKPSPLNRVIDSLSKRPGMKKERHRYITFGKSCNPKTFLIPPGSKEAPPGGSETQWYGERVEIFQTWLGNYKSKTNGGDSTDD